MWNPLTVYLARKLNGVSSLAPPPPNLDGTKRKVLVIQCHPLSDSFSTAIAGSVKKGLLTAGHDVRLRKLYYNPQTDNTEECYNGSTFPAALSGEERAGYHVQENVQMRTNSLKQSAKVPNLAIEVQQAIEDLVWCDSLVFVYPTWWFNFPAVLKGYVDRVLLPGVAFFLPGSSGTGTGGTGTGGTGLVAGLTHITKIGVVTTSGASALTTFYAGNGARSFISTALRALCAPECPLLWHQLYEISSTTDAERKNFLADVEQAYSTF